MSESIAERYSRLAREGAGGRRVDVALRSLDVLFSALFLLLSLPVTLVIAALILATSGTPLFYRGERVGLGGRVFTMLKFRTLRRGAEARLGPYLGPELVARTRAETTRVGAWLRATQLDEIPQLWNVLRGDMSLVGPRPIRPRFFEELALGNVDAPGDEGQLGIVGQAGHDRVDPVRGHPGVVVDERDQLVLRPAPARVAGDRRAGDVAPDVGRVVPDRHLPDRRVAGRGVDHDQLVVRPDDARQGGETAVQQLRPVPRGDDDGEPGAGLRARFGPLLRQHGPRRCTRAGSVPSSSRTSSHNDQFWT